MTAAARGWRLPPIVFGIGTIVVAFAIVEGLIRTDVISQYVMPTPSEVLLSFGRVITEEEIPHRFLATAGECLAAGALMTVFGVSLGVALHRFRLFRAATETWVAAFAAAPLVLAYPLFLVIFGRSAWTIIMIGFLAGLAPVALKTLEGLSGVRPALLNVGRSYRLTPAQLFWKVLFPAAVPTIFVGLRLGLIFALINVVGVEFLINFGGLGQLINELAERYDLPGTYAAITFVILVSVLFFITLEGIERWLRPAS